MNLYIDKNKTIYNAKYNQNLTFWEFLFWQNFPIQINDKSQIADCIKTVSKVKIKELKNLSRAEFNIDTTENKAIDMVIAGILRTAIESKDMSYVKVIQNDIEEFRGIQAYVLGRANFNNYKKLICILEKANYPETFQCLILNEFLSKLYKFNTEGLSTKVEQQPRKLNKSIFGIIDLSAYQLEYIYKNAENFSKDNLTFADLYLQSFISYKKYIETNLKEYISLSNNKKQKKIDRILNYFKKNLNTNVNTLERGKWLKFCSAKHDPKNYTKNSECISGLLYNTNNCLKNNAEKYLSDGDIYIFIDNENNPRIIITMLNNVIWEVRGVDGGQEIQKGYIDVALEFLKQNGQEQQYWYRRIETNKQLIEYKEQLQNGSFNFNNFEDLLMKMAVFDRISVEGDNPNLVDIKELIPSFIKDIAKVYECDEDEILFGQYDCNNIHEIDFCKIKIVLGEIDFSGTDIKNLGSIEMIYKVKFGNSQIQDFCNLRKCIFADKKDKIPEETQVLTSEVFYEQILMK